MLFSFYCLFMQVKKETIILRLNHYSNGFFLRYSRQGKHIFYILLCY
nr:MAG TPA: hypothetical protein [Caudoviricetes sp.]